MRKLGSVRMAIVVATALLATIAFTNARAQGKQRPHGKPAARLLVVSGSVGLAGEKLTGSFVVRNKGQRGSGPFVASVVIPASGKDVVAKRYPMRPLAASASRTVRVAVAVPAGLPNGSSSVKACVRKPARKGQRRKPPRCLAVGTVRVGDRAAPPAPTVPGSASSVPTDPVAFTKGVVFTLADPGSDYWIYVPDSYDATHMTPTTLFVWLHGCGGESAGDIYTVSPGGSQDWISIAVGGREGQCWDPGGDQAKVLAAIAGVKTHFNVDPHRVILGGYSSGGDLAYRLAFYNASMFAGVLAENTAPFRDTGSTQAASLAAASWKFNVVHLAHLGDEAYPIAEVRAETDAMIAAGFPLTRIELPGAHYEEPGTDADLVNHLLPHIDDGWRSP